MFAKNLRDLHLCLMCHMVERLMTDHIGRLALYMHEIELKMLNFAVQQYIMQIWLQNLSSDQHNQNLNEQNIHLKNCFSSI